MASICCSPPESLVPWLESRSRRFGNNSKMRSSDRPPGRTCNGSSRFSFTSSVEKMPRSSGQKAIPARAIASDGAADQFLALEAHRAGAAFDDAHDGFERRRLADAVAAEQRHHFAGLNVEGDAMQDVRLAVPGLQIVDR